MPRQSQLQSTVCDSGGLMVQRKNNGRSNDCGPVLQGQEEDDSIGCQSVSLLAALQWVRELNRGCLSVSLCYRVRKRTV